MFKGPFKIKLVFNFEKIPQISGKIILPISDTNVSAVPCLSMLGAYFGNLAVGSKRVT